MILTFGDSLRLVGKEHAWELQKRRTRGGRQTWAPVKFYRRLGHALVEVGERQIRLADGNTISEALDAFTRVTHDLQQILDLALEGIEQQADSIEIWAHTITCDGSTDLELKK